MNIEKSENFIPHFFQEFAKLKQLKRQGWLERGIPEAKTESVADHIFGMHLLALSFLETSHKHLEKAKVYALISSHELGEIEAGDITPSKGISDERKSKLEKASVLKTLETSGAPSFFFDIWQEYELGKTPEASFVKDIDKLEMALQAKNYRHEYKLDAEEFIESARQKISDPLLQSFL